MATILLASLSSAAAATALARSMARCVAATRSSCWLCWSMRCCAGQCDVVLVNAMLYWSVREYWSVRRCCSVGYESVGASRPCGRIWPIQLVLRDVLHDAVGHEVPDRFAGHDAGATVGGADGQGRNHLQCHPVLR